MKWSDWDTCPSARGATLWAMEGTTARFTQRVLTSAAIVGLVSGCSASATTQTSRPPISEPEPVDAAAASEQPPVRDGEALHAPFEDPSVPPIPERTVKIATFNLGQFGASKASRPGTLATLGSIIRAYDVVAVQGIADISGKAPKALLEAINQEGSAYELSLSPRTGEQPDDQAGAEQYGFFYNTKTIQALGTPALYDDAEHDDFQREPWTAWFAVKDGEFSFVLVNLHTAPERALQEISALAHVALWVQDHYRSEDDIIFLGNLNAGCDDASPAQLDPLAIRSEAFQWFVPDDADTNVAESSCAYDRILATASTTGPDYHGTWGVHQAFTDNGISSHYPVWAEFWTHRDTNEPRPLDIDVEDLRPKPKAKPAPKLSDAQIKTILIRESIASYPGNCPCPYNTASNGSRCGRRSAWSRGGGYSPLCEASDVSQDMVESYRATLGQ